MKKPAILYTILFSGLGVFSCMLLAGAVNLPESTSSVALVLFFVLAFNILGYTTLSLSSWINAQYPIYIRRRWRIVAIYGLVTLMLLMLNYSLLVAAKFVVGASNPWTFPNGGVGILVIVWLVELVILGLLIANKSIQNALKLEQQAAQLLQENNTARYTALQNQLNPHFLFNSLNTLIAEIEYQPKNAVAFTRNLSDVYRYVLQCQERPLVSLASELEFAQAYLFLHEVRLGNCLSCVTDIAPDYMESQLPPLTLQLLVENVIKHNAISTSRPMVIHIAARDHYLEVSNAICPKTGVDSAGIGLGNLSNRCTLMLGRPIEVIKSDQIFTVKVPLMYE